MGSKKSNSGRKRKPAEFRRNRRKRQYGGLDERLLQGDVEWDDDEQTTTQEQMAPPGESQRQRQGISHAEALLAAGEEGTEGLLEGLVIEVHGKWCLVHHDGQDLRCAVRGKLRELALNQRSIVTAGDRVQFELSGDERGLIRQILPRRNEIARCYLGQDHKAHVVVANVDQMIIVSSVHTPPLWPGLIDRYLVVAYTEKIAPLICINKCDLDEADEVQPCLEEYRALGYTCLASSAVTGKNFEVLEQSLRGKTSVFVGQSGVGKSTILNRLCPELELTTGPVSEATGKGRHITTRARLIPFPGDAFVVDTPGVRGFDPFQLEPEDVHDAFPDIVAAARACRFPNCRHIDEPECAVKQGVETGRILERRYASYLSIFE